MAPTKDTCMRAIAAIVMTLQEIGASRSDIVDSLEAAARCERRLRKHVETEQRAALG